MAYRDSTAATTTGTSINATKPALLQTGDILLCYLITDIGLNAPAPTITAPAGWALISGSNQGSNSSAPDGFTSWVYWKLASNSEPSTWNFAQNGGSTQIIAIVTCHSGRNPNPTFITHGSVNTTGNATPVTVSDSGITANTNDDIVVFATGDITVGTDTWGFSPPTNYTERQDTQVSFDVATAATRDEVSSGATGTLSPTLTRSAGTGTSGWGIFVIAIPADNAVRQPTPTFTMRSGMNINLVRLHSPIPPQPFNEDINIDKWYGQYDNPVQKYFPAAALAASLFFSPVISQVETITVDKWVQSQSQPQNKISYKQAGGEYRFEVPRQVLISDWYQAASEPVRRKPTQLLGGESRFELPRTILLSDWYQPVSQPLKQPIRQAGFGEYKFELPRTALVTDWWQPVSIPTLRKPTQLLAGESRFELPRSILLSDWYKEIVQPYFSKTRQAPSGEYRVDVISPVENITIDRWFQPTSQPYFTKFRNVHFGESRFEVPRLILLSDWFVDIKQPHFGKFRLTAFGEYKFEVPRTVLISDWHQPISLPVSKIKQRILSGETRVDMVSAVETITIDKWYQPAVQIFASKYRYAHASEFRLEVPRTILISDWFQPVFQPAVKKRQFIISDVFILAESVTVDKWFQSISQPILRKYLPIHVGESRVDILRTILITDWWQPNPEYIVVKKYALVFFGEYGFNTQVSETIRENIYLTNAITTTIYKHSLVSDSVLADSKIVDNIVLDSLITELILHLDSLISTVVELESIID